MAPARSIQCIRRPPSRAASGLASLGNTVSAISDCESRTGRGESEASLMVGLPFFLSLRSFVRWVLRFGFSTFLLKIRFQKALRHLLDPRIVVPAQPSRSGQVKFEIAIFDGPVISFTNVTQKQNASSPVRGILCQGLAGRRTDRESYCIPASLRRRPATTTGISKIAERFQNILRGNFALMAGSRAVAAPSNTERKPCGVRPIAILKFRHGHEVRASHSLISQSGIVGSGNCNQLKQVWPVPLGRRRSFEQPMRYAAAVVVISSAGTARFFLETPSSATYGPHRHTQRNSDGKSKRRLR